MRSAASAAAEDDEVGFDGADGDEAGAVAVCHDDAVEAFVVFCCGMEEWSGMKVGEGRRYICFLRQRGGSDRMCPHTAPVARGVWEREGLGGSEWEGGGGGASQQSHILRACCCATPAALVGPAHGSSGDPPRLGPEIARSHGVSVPAPRRRLSPYRDHNSQRLITRYDTERNGFSPCPTRGFVSD